MMEVTARLRGEQAEWRRGWDGVGRQGEACGRQPELETTEPLTQRDRWGRQSVTS